MKFIIVWSIKWKFFVKRQYSFSILSFNKDDFDFEKIDPWNLERILKEEFLAHNRGWSNNWKHYRIHSIAKL